jgi:WD40 repeat protein
VRFDNRPLAAHEGIVSDVVFSPTPGQRRLVSAGIDGRVLLWDIDAAPPLARRVSIPDEKTVAALAFSPDATRLFAGRGKDLEAWALDSPRRLWQVAAHASDIDGIVVLPGGRSLVTYSGFSRELARWTLDEHGATRSARAETLEGLGDMVMARAGGEIVVRTYGVLRAYRADDLGLGAEVKAAGTLPFGELAVGPGDDEVMVATQGREVLVYGPRLTLRRHLQIAGSPLALAGEARTGLVAAVIQGRNDSVWVWPRDASTPVTPALRVEGQQIATVDVLAISVDGRTLFGSGMGFSALWDLQAMSPLGILLPGHSRGPKAVASSSSAPLVATSSWDGEILLWNLDPQQWVADACRMANRNLSCVEWQAVEGARTWRATCPGLPAPQPTCP